MIWDALEISRPKTSKTNDWNSSWFYLDHPTPGNSTCSFFNTPWKFDILNPSDWIFSGIAQCLTFLSFWLVWLGFFCVCSLEYYPASPMNKRLTATCLTSSESKICSNVYICIISHCGRLCEYPNICLRENHEKNKK